jgi:hypothetical protein
MGAAEGTGTDGATVEGATVTTGAKGAAVGGARGGVDTGEPKSSGRMTLSTTWITPLHAKTSVMTTSGSYSVKSIFKLHGR